MRIGIDIDDTITNSKEYVTNLKKHLYPEYDYNKNLPEDVFLEFINKYDSVIHKNVELKDGVKESLDYLKEQGHEIIFITARGEFSKTSEEDTLNYFKEYNIPYDKLICEAYDKGKIAFDNKIDIFIDDLLTNCRRVNTYGIKVIKFARPDDQCEGEFVVFDNWKDIIKYIDEIKED